MSHDYVLYQNCLVEKRSLSHIKSEQFTIERLDQGHLYPLGEHPGGQTVSLPLPEIEHWSPVKHAGTIPKELSSQLMR
jgi:hypothetical protein